MILDLTPEQEISVEACLNDPGEYSKVGNNCRGPIQNFLKKINIDTGDKILPVSLGNELLDMSAVKGTIEHPASRPANGFSAPWATK